MYVVCPDIARNNRGDMNDRIPYREPTTPDARPSPPTPRQSFRVGLVISGASLAPILTPLVIKVGEAGKYLVAFGLALLFLGINCLVNAAIDWLRGR